MKKKLLILIPGIALLSSPFLLNTNRPYQVADAYNIGLLPSKIDLNDTNEKDVRAYYSNLNSLSASERKGSNLLKNLKPILKNNQQYYSYDSGAKVWQAYEITDRDWVKSPAKDIPSYDPDTNTITKYSYGSSQSNPGSNPFIHALYVNRDKDNKVHAWVTESTGKTSHGNNAEWCIDREHIWPKSFGFENEAQGGARGDLMHLWAGDSYTNSALHSNYYYGYVDLSRDHLKGDSKYSYLAGNYFGYSRTVGGDLNVFEPQDSDKGDIARSLFYMAARYNYLSGDDSDGIDSNNPNLEIVNDLNAWVRNGYQSTASKTGKIGLIQDLLEWNKLDPVDEYEIHRNNILYNNFTKNRNPFIDFPEWADYVWGEPSEENYAKPQSDVIGVSLLTISKTSISIEPNKTFTLTASSTKTNTFTWSVSDESILSLDTTTGNTVTVTALKEGNATVSVSIVVDDETVKKDCSVTVAVKQSPTDFLKNLPLPVIIGVAAGILVIVVIIIVILINSKKARKAVVKATKKQIKKTTSNNKKKKKK